MALNHNRLPFLLLAGAAFVAGIVLVFLPRPPAERSRLRIGCSAGILPVARRLLPEFEATTGIDAELVGPRDSADLRLAPQETTGTAAPSGIPFARGSLALCQSPRGHARIDDPSDLTSGSLANALIGLPDPAFEPEGRIAATFLATLGVRRGRMGPGGTAEQIRVDVASGSALFAILPASCLKGGSDPGILLDEFGVGPLVYVAQVREHSPFSPQARRFVGMLLDERGRQTLHDFGFGAVEQPHGS